MPEVGVVWALGVIRLRVWEEGVYDFDEPLIDAPRELGDEQCWQRVRNVQASLLALI